jgi:glycosidase
MKLRLLISMIALGAMGLTTVACGDDDDDNGTSGSGGKAGGSGRGGSPAQGGSAGAPQGGSGGAPQGGSAGATQGAGGTGGSAGSGGEVPATVASKPVIYQLVVRHFGNLTTNRTKDGTIEQNGVGKFADINEAALASLKDLGVSHVWLTGVLRQATLTSHADLDPALGPDDPDVVKGRAGSFYAVRDYYDVCPDYAVDRAKRLDEFGALVTRTHEAGLKVLIDLVPNHVARNYGSVVEPEKDFGKGDDQTVFFSPNNNFFYLQQDAPLALTKPATWNPPGLTFDGRFAREDGTAGREVKVTGNSDIAQVAPTSPAPGADDWYETIKLNYGQNFQGAAPAADPVPSTWAKMNDIIAYWQGKGVDGFRVDFAHWVPDAAWQYLIGEARKRKADTYFMAEAYANLPGLLADGFDSVYNDGLYDALRDKYQGGSIDNVERRIADVAAQDRSRYVQYLENHDECRIPAGSACDGKGAFFGANAGRQLGPLSYLVSSGPVIVYNGQEVGESGVGDEGFGGEDGRTSIFDYWSLPELQKWSNGHKYDGGGLTADQKSLRDYYGALLKFVQEPLVRGGGFRTLLPENPRDDVNNKNVDLYPFARYEAGANGRLLVVVVNFRPEPAGSGGAIKLPADLLDAVGIGAGASKSVKLVFDGNGAVASPTATPATREQLMDPGIPVSVPDQRALVYVIE